ALAILNHLDPNPSTLMRLPLGGHRQPGASLRAHACWDPFPGRNSSVAAHELRGRASRLELLDDLARVLVARVPHPLEGGLAEGADVGPLRPGDLADQLRLAPDGEPGLRTGRRPDGEGALRALSLVQLPRQVVDVALLQARADPAREVEGLGLALA